MTEAEHYRAADTPKQGLHDSVGAFATMDDSLQESLAPLRGSPPSPATRVFGALGHGFIGGLLVLAVLAPMAYSLPWYGTNASTTLSGWWGVNAKVKGSGHSEMVVPTYFFLGTVLPIVVAGLLHAFLHKRAPVGRLSLLSQFLHRKPKLFNSLISNGEIGFVIVVTALNVVVFYYQFMKRYKPTNATADTIKNVGTALGFTGLFDMVLIALPATRHSFWMEWLGIPYAHGVKYHNWISVATIVTFLAHTICFVVYYATVGKLSKLLPCVTCDMATDGLANWEYFFGILAMSCMLVIGITSLPYVRRHYYSVFYATHFLFIPASLFAVLHWGNIIYFLFTSMVLYMVNRLLSTSSITTPVAIKRAVPVSSDVVEISFECTTGYNPGDAVWIKVPALSKTQWHPFSVASTPLETPGSLTIYVKTLGKWTMGLHHYIGECQERNVQPIIYVDGGYTPTAPIPASHSDVVFVGGGIGITPLMGQLMHVLLSRPTQNAWLIWNVRHKDMLVCFQSWLHRIETVGGNRLKIRLFVTQDDVTDFEIDTKNTKVLHHTNADATTVQPRPYVHLRTDARVVMLLLAFGFSGGLLVAVTYGSYIQRVPAKYWIVQRIVQYFVVLLGAVFAHVVAKCVCGRQPLALPSTEVPLNTDDGAAHHFSAQSGRSNLAALFQEIQATATATVGVYVSGPKTLSQAVDAHGQGISTFHIRHEVFEM